MSLWFAKRVITSIYGPTWQKSRAKFLGPMNQGLKKAARLAYVTTIVRRWTTRQALLATTFSSELHTNRGAAIGNGNLEPAGKRKQ